MPVLVSRKSDLPVRIWVAGCSSGEEPYTIAMTLSEFMNTSLKKRDYAILATDISRQALSAALEGIYPHQKLKELPIIFRKKSITLRL